MRGDPGGRSNRALCPREGGRIVGDAADLGTWIEFGGFVGGLFGRRVVVSRDFRGVGKIRVWSILVGLLVIRVTRCQPKWQRRNEER